MTASRSIEKESALKIIINLGSMNATEAFHELSFYTLSHPDQKYFIHQHIVDAFQAQTATAATKPISLFFSVVGLYLFAEHQYTGRAIQQVHMQLAKNKKPWPSLIIPEHKGLITVMDVLKAKDSERDQWIKQWCTEVWKAYEINGKIIDDFLQGF